MVHHSGGGFTILSHYRLRVLDKKLTPQKNNNKNNNNNNNNNKHTKPMGNKGSANVCDPWVLVFVTFGS